MVPLNPQPYDIALLLGCATLVVIMQAGFCCLESGLVRSKNSINVALKNVMDFCIGSLTFWLVGYGLMFGASRQGLFGTTGWVFGHGAGPWELSFFLFQLVFCGTAVTIISGAVAERMRFVGYLVIAVLVSGIVYPFIGHWVWGGVADAVNKGWLKELGFIDYAGSTVVHSTGGWVALAAVLVVGPRLGRFTTGAPPIYGHNLPMVALGVLLLWFGWFGFNGGSAYSVNSQIPAILVNTTMAAAAGGLTALALTQLLLGQPRVEHVLNGVIAGLVGITAGCHVMAISSAVVVGAVGGAICLLASLALEKKKIDDAIGAIPAHAGAGAWGTIAVALLGDPQRWGTGLGRLDQLMVQLIGVAVCFAWSFGVGWVLLRLVNWALPLRIDAQGEQTGLNVSEHGAQSPMSDLVDDMIRHREKGDFSHQVAVEPHTEVGVIAQEYNRVLDKVNREIQAREQISQALLTKNQDLQLLQTVAAEANQATNVDRVLTVILEKVCAHTDWPVGHAYLPDTDNPTLLRPTQLWYLRHPQPFETFKRVTETTSFEQGIGLPGRVLASGKPAWIIDVTQDTNFPRAKLAEDLGVKAGFAFPVLVGAEVVAVLEFFSSEAMPPNEPLLEVMANVGTQLGRAIERKRAEDELRHLADHDRLTGLANRQLFTQRLGEAIEHTKQSRYFHFAVLFIDVDRFKLVNDSLGHEVGDHLLISIAHRIRQVLDQISQNTIPLPNLAARLGGDEFVVLIQGTLPNDPDHIARQLQDALATPHMVAGREVSMTASIGIATSREEYEHPEDLLRNADLAMYHAKASGKGRYVTFDKRMHEGAVERLNLETDLRQAVEQNQFKLQYQPIVCLESGRLLGFEALIRWDHPLRGMVRPDRFISIAEETGLIVPISEWVIQTAAGQLKQWHDRYPEYQTLAMNINLSKNHLIQPGVVEQVSQLLQAIGVDLHTVTLEVTESMIMDNEVVVPVLHQLREMGMKLAMDDFGTGHSSMSNLYRFPIDMLKIDRSFISVMDQNRGYPAIVHAIVTLAHNLGMIVVAEGIETVDQVAQLQALECDRGQGYIFARPLDPQDAEQRINGQMPLAKSA